MKEMAVQKSFCNTIKPGTAIVGKWKKHRYVVKRKLGAGAIGTVYLCNYKGTDVALKISNQNTSITVEVNVLKELNKVQGNILGPYLLDVDDWETSFGNFSFYVMEFLRGGNLRSFIQINGSEWLELFIIQLLRDLDALHRSGWVFGDLKIDNLIVIHSPPRVRWVDVGGTTKIGRSIKEYTEFYDRGYWGLGSRRAEPSYDLFSLVMVILTAYYPKQFPKSAHPERLLFSKIDQIHALKPFRTFLKKAIVGKYDTSKDMMEDMIDTLYNRRIMKQRRQKERVYRGLPFLVEIIGITLLVMIYYIISIYIS